MPFTLEQLDFLGVHVGVSIPPEFVENKRREMQFRKRSAELTARADEMKKRHDGSKLEALLIQAVDAADRKNFAGALDLLEELEVGLNAPDLPPPPTEPPPQPPQQPEEDLASPAPDLSTPEGVYRSEKAKLIGVINAAAAESADIGGEDIRTWVDKMEAKEQAADWPAATEILRKTHQKAGLLNQRKPYITARQRHIHKINAAKKIKVVIPAADKSFGKHKTFGDAVTADWDAVLGLVKNNDFKGAAAGVIALANKIDTKITPAVAKAREENAKQLNGLTGELEAAKGKGDLVAMRTLAEKIFKNTAEAENLGVDPGENARKPFSPDAVWTADKCEKAFVEHDWFGLKKCRKARRIKIESDELVFPDDAMWKLVQYRGKVVNEVIDSLRKEFPTLIAKASGSEDIESDIDITFATPGSGDDVTAAEKFNKIIKDRFKKPPGRVFDVNIYPRDYGDIKESFKADYNVEEIKDEKIDEPDQEESAKLSKIDQDVATLLKQRRFLDTEKFNEMLDSLLNQAPDEATRKRIEKQHEEGEDIYLLTSLEKVEKIRAKVALGKPSGYESKHKKLLREKLALLDSLKNKSDLESLAKMQKLLPEVLDLFEEEMPAETMDVTDALYLEKMGTLRADQQSIRSLKEETASTDSHHPGQTCEEAHPKKEHDAWRKEHLNALEVKVKKDMFTNIVFANEAIMSQGALKHVVVALQAKTKEEKENALNLLETSDLMQSVNEQVADLAKEMKHYEGVVDEAGESGDAKSKQAAKRVATGEGFVHASKYFFRLLDAAILLIEKFKDNEEVSAVVSQPYQALKTKGNLTLEALKKRVDDVLLKLRKSAVIPPDVKGEVGALEIEEIFQNVTDIATFRKMITDFAIELNLRIRSMEDFKKSQEMGTDKEKAAEKAYFKAAAPKPGKPTEEEFPPPPDMPIPPVVDQKALGEADQQHQTLAGQAAAAKGRAKFASTEIDSLLAQARKALAAKDVKLAKAANDALAKLYVDIDATLKQRAKNELAANEKAKQRQQNLADQFSGQLQSVKKSYFTEGVADRYGKEKLKAGKEFKSFLVELKKVEVARAKAKKDSKSGKPVPVDTSELEAAARKYLAHFDEDLSEKEQKGKESQRKKQICETTLVAIRDWKLAEEMESLGAPPWDEEGEVKANALFTKIMFEEDADNPAAPLGSESGVSAAFWVERTDFEDGTFDPKTGRFKPDKNAKKKQFIFKPTDGEAEIEGFPEGGSAIREVMAMSASSAIQGATGIDFNMPPTTIVAIDNEKLGSVANTKGEVIPTRIGSMQKFSKNKGVAASVMDEDPELIKRIPAEETQKLAILDLVSLNLDRHSGNVMIDEPSGKNGPAKLVPIDHGLVFPTREALQSRRTKMSPVGHNVIGQLPGKDEKFSDELLEKIRLMDPDEIVNGMKKSLAVMAKTHPEANFDKQIGEENFKLVRRSVEFLKRAAAELTPAELFDAYSRCMEQIFDTADDAKEEAFSGAIETAKKRSAACKEVGELGTQGRKRMFEEIQNLGWAQSIMKEGIDNWLSFNADLAVKIYKGGIENPATRQEANDLLQEMGKTLADFKLENETLKTQRSILQGEYQRWLDQGGKPKRSKEALQSEFQKLGGKARLQALFKAFPDTSVPPESGKFTREEEEIFFLKSWEEYEAAGGDAAFDKLALNERRNVPARNLLLRRATADAKAGEDLGKNVDPQQMAQREVGVITTRAQKVDLEVQKLPKSPFRDSLTDVLKKAIPQVANNPAKARMAIIGVQNKLIAVAEVISTIQVPLDFLGNINDVPDCVTMVQILTDAKRLSNLGEFEKAEKRRLEAIKVFEDRLVEFKQRFEEIRSTYPKESRPPTIVKAVNDTTGPIESAAIQSAPNLYRRMAALEKAVSEYEDSQPAKKGKSKGSAKKEKAAKPVKSNSKRGSKK